MPNAVYQHEDGTTCVWDGTAWYIPYDIGGEGETCTLAHHVNSSTSEAPEVKETPAEKLRRVVDESEAKMCECGRIDKLDDPHRHERDEMCDAWQLLGHVVLDVMHQRDMFVKELNAFTNADNGAGLIYAERQRQIHEEGYTIENDRRHPVHDFVKAAGAYLGLSRWPWNSASLKKEDGDGYIVKRNLVKAGALIAAGIDRLIDYEKRERNGNGS